MRRSSPRWLRLITTLWSFWFVAFLAQPAPLVAPLMSAAMGTQAMAVNVAHAPATSAMPDMAGMPSEGAAPISHQHAPVNPTCVHLGACCCAPVLTVPLDAAPRIAPAPIRVVDASIPSNVALTPPPAPAHARPFAIGPPSPAILG